MFRVERYPRPWRLTLALPPRRIETARLVLRCWEAGDAPHFATSFRQSRAHVGAWIAPANDESLEAHAIETRIATFQADFEQGIGFVYAIFDRAEQMLLGEIGLMPRRGPASLEIGYWIHVDHVGHGLATEATRALTIVALSLPEVDRVEIHCDPRNAASAAVPRKLGYRLAAQRSRGSPGDESGRDDTVVFVFATSDHADGPPTDEPTQGPPM